MVLEGKKGEMARQWGDNSYETYVKIDAEAQRRTLEFIECKNNEERKARLLIEEGYDPNEAYDFKEHIQEKEIELLKAALEQNRFNQKKTAEYLGMTYHQLRGYLRKYELTEGE